MFDCPVGSEIRSEQICHEGRRAAQGEPQGHRFVSSDHTRQ